MRVNHLEERPQRSELPVGDGAHALVRSSHMRSRLGGPSARAPWRAFVLALADSLDGLLDGLGWVGPDSVEATWKGKQHSITLRLCGDSERGDSLEVECVSNRLAGLERRERGP